MASKTFIAGGTNNNWGTANNWSPVASVPAAGDDVILNASSPNCVINVNTANLKSFDMTGYTNTITHTHSKDDEDRVITVTGVAGETSVVILTTLGGNDININPASTAILNLSTLSILTGHIIINGAGTINILTNLNIHAIRLTQGTLHADGASDNLGLTHTLNEFTSSNSNTRSLYMGTSTWNITSYSRSSEFGPYSDQSWYITGTGLTFDGGTSTIRLKNMTADSYFMGMCHMLSFCGMGFIYYNVIIDGSRVYNPYEPYNFEYQTYEIQGSNTFNIFTIETPASITMHVDFEEGKTQTFNSFVAEGTSGHTIQINSGSAGVATSLSQAVGTIFCDYLLLQDNAAIGGALWNAGANSVNVSGNSGWYWGDSSSSISSSSSSSSCRSSSSSSSSSSKSSSSSSSRSSSSSSSCRSSSSSFSDPMLIDINNVCIKAFSEHFSSTRNTRSGSMKTFVEGTAIKITMIISVPTAVCTITIADPCDFVIIDNATMTKEADCIYSYVHQTVANHFGEGDWTVTLKTTFCGTTMLTQDKFTLLNNRD